LWQGRFASFVLDDHHLLAATRYVEMNPVRAGMVDRPQAYPWSSASAHLAGRNDVLVKSAPLLEIVGDWRAFLSQPPADETLGKLRHHERTGRPLGDDDFLANLERLLNRVLKPRKPGRKPKKQVK
jgi:putative transposase